MNKTSAKKDQPINWKWLCTLIAVVGGIPLLLYANTCSYGLIFNDGVTLKHVFTSQITAPEAYLRPFAQPYVRSSFFDDVSHYKSAYGWFHFVNVWIHLSAAVALSLVTFAVARRLAPPDSEKLAPYTVAGLAGLIYGCHPLATQTASYVSARWGSLGASNFLFALLFFILMLSTAGAIRVWCIIAMCACSIMCITSSEVGLVLVPSMVALFYLLKPARFTPKAWALERPIVTGLTGLFSLVVPMLLLFGFGSTAAPNSYGMPPLSHAAYYATQAKAFLTYYTRAFFAPFGISVDPPFAQASSFADFFAIGGILLFAGCIYAMYRWRSHKLLFLGLWLAVVGFLPHALLYQPESVSDPSFYLSLSGLSLVASWALCEIWRGSLKAEAPKMVAVVTVLALLSFLHNGDFKDSMALANSTLKTNQRSVIANCVSAQTKLHKADYAGAIKDADEAISLDPQSAMGYFIRGAAQLRERQDTEAKNSFEKAQDRATRQELRILPDVKYALAEAYLNMDKVDKASEVAKEAFALDPYSPRAKYTMGMIALKQRNWPMAMGYLEQSLKEGVADARLPGARVLLGLQQYDQALEMAKRLVALEDSPEAQLILGNAALARLDLKTAEPALTAALKANPHNAEAMALLSILYERKGDKAVAESYHKDALELDPKIYGKLLMPHF